TGGRFSSSRSAAMFVIVVVRVSFSSSSASLVWISLSITQSSTICMASVIIHDRPNSWSLRTTRSLLTRRRRSPSSGDSGIVPAGPDVALGAVPGAVGAALGLGRGRRCAGASGGMLACLSTVERDHEQRVGRGQDDVLGLGAGLLQPCSVEIGDAVLGELVVL